MLGQVAGGTEKVGQERGRARKKVDRTMRNVERKMRRVADGTEHGRPGKTMK